MKEALTFPLNLHDIIVFYQSRSNLQSSQHLLNKHFAMFSNKYNHLAYIVAYVQITAFNQKLIVTSAEVYKEVLTQVKFKHVQSYF